MEQQVLEFRRYPRKPGTKTRGTGPSGVAARTIEPKVTGLRALVLQALREHGPLTADEIAIEIGCSILSCRPRVSELFKLGLIRETEHRRLNDSGCFATVYEAV